MRPYPAQCIMAWALIAALAVVDPQLPRPAETIRERVSRYV
jgi:hypothetical protein